MSADRKPQLAYSELQGLMLDEQHRRTKARKIRSVLFHFLGRDDLNGLSVMDIGCSAGFIADELALAGARTIGLDIDVPGLAKAHQKFGSRVNFLCAAGERIPVADESLDVVVFNHIYEHVVDPDAVVADIHRVLRPDGIAYLGLGNKYQIMEPHYRLPLLSWLPQRSADHYVRAFGRAEEYYEHYRTRGGLRRMLTGFNVWDYTVPVILDSQAFNNTDTVNGGLSKLPEPVIRATMPIVPTFIWIATKGSGQPRGRRLRSEPRRVR
ncbi:MAG TPA: class I SAM-dependent methyltransferase [Mycobacteriales bacterium]|jgi:2-polyprenyl-3-methyl-5-hydroxy-6-metoxy-1,4-benzoquinol methylase